LFVGDDRGRNFQLDETTGKKQALEEQLPVQ
jgi:hypothetical protein